MEAQEIKMDKNEGIKERSHGSLGNKGIKEGRNEVMEAQEIKKDRNKGMKE